MQGIWSQLVLGIIGAISGFAFQLDWWATLGRFDSLQSPSILIKLARSALVATAVLFGLKTIMRWALHPLPLPDRAKSDYRKYDTLTYPVFLLSLSGAVGIQLSLPLLYILGFAFLAAQFLLAFLL
jgi:hypothetical protein